MLIILIIIDIIEINNTTAMTSGAVIFSPIRFTRKTTNPTDIIDNANDMVT
jgi:hypothetical protein